MAGNEIIFEDLHGVREDKPVTVDLDADSKEDGITRTPVVETADAGGADNDDVQFDDLRGAQAPPQDDGEDDASRASEDDAYSKKVKARIQRATRSEKKAKTEAGYWKSQAERLAKETYERDKTTAEKTIEQAGAAIKQAEADLEKAFEDGESKDQVRLTSRLTDLKADKLLAEASLENLSPDGNVQPFDGKIDTVPDKSLSLAAKWKEERSDWYAAEGFERQTRLANRLDKQVFKDGYEPDTEEYFEELDRRIKAKAPDLYDDDGSDDAGGADDSEEQRRSRRSPVAGVQRRDSRSATSGNKVELTERDFANMRRFNLDTNDPDVLKEYAQNKKAADAEERQ